MKQTLSILGVLLFLLPLTGCGDKNPGTVPVSVKITQKGSPLSNAIVTIVSSDGKGHSASGLTDADVTATLKTTDGWKGAFPGQYNVAIMKWENVTLPNPTPDAPNGTRTEQKNGLPAKYKDHAKSGFTLDVQKGATATFDIPE